jgi:hypothetical protein
MRGKNELLCSSPSFIVGPEVELQLEFSVDFQCFVCSWTKIRGRKHKSARIGLFRAEDPDEAPLAISFAKFPKVALPTEALLFATVYEARFFVGDHHLVAKSNTVKYG